MSIVLYIIRINFLKIRIYLFALLSVVNLFIYASENIFNCCNLYLDDVQKSEEYSISNDNISIKEHDNSNIDSSGKNDIEQNSISNIFYNNSLRNKFYFLKEGYHKYEFNSPRYFSNFENSIEKNPQPSNDLNIKNAISNKIEDVKIETIFEGNGKIANNNSSKGFHSKLREIKKIKKNKNKRKENSKIFTSSKRKKLRKIKSVQKNKRLKNTSLKYPLNNLIRKTKRILIENLLVFLNKKIPEFIDINEILKFIKNKMPNITNLALNKIKNKNTFLLSLNGDFCDDVSVENNKLLLNQTLGEILSNDISGHFTWFDKSFNKYIVDFLYDNSSELKQILDLSFIDFINCFCGFKNITFLKGLKKWFEVKRKFYPKKSQYNKEYLNRLDYLLKNYSKLILQRKKK